MEVFETWRRRKVLTILLTRRAINEEMCRRIKDKVNMGVNFGEKIEVDSVSR